MAARKKNNNINLIPKEEFTSSVIGRLLAWLLSTFRFIVIVVEMVVMGAFFSRFWFDSKNSDLADEMKQKEAQVLASKQTEAEFRLIQRRLGVFADLTKENKYASSYLKEIVVSIPTEIILSSIDFSESGILLSGQAPDERSIAQLVVNLEAGGTRQVSISQIAVNREDKSLIDFSLSIQNATTKTENKEVKS